MARMFEILSSATKQRIGVEIRRNDIYYFYDKEILAIESLIETPDSKVEQWKGDLYEPYQDGVQSTISGSKEDIAKQCVSYALKKKTEMENTKKFGKPPVF